MGVNSYGGAVIPYALSAIRNLGANAEPFDPLGSGFSLRAPRNDGVLSDQI